MPQDIQSYDCITPNAAVDFANRDLNRLVGQVALFIGKKSAYTDTIEGGVLDSSSDVIRSVVSEQAVPTTSMTVPVFLPMSQVCGSGGGVAQVGTTEYQFQLQNLRGRGPKVCVKTTRTGFKSSYSAAFSSLKQMLLRLQNADIRANYYLYGGSKAVIDSTGTFAQDFAGNINTLGNGLGTFPNRTPDTVITHRSIETIASYMREVLNVEPFTMAGVQEGVMKWVGSIESNQIMRDELNIGYDIRALTTGRYRLGEETITGYGFSGPYHAIMHGVDPERLRASAVIAGVPTLEEPTAPVATTTGYGDRPNPDWITAGYEIGFLFGQNSFKRLVPSYAKVAGWDFSEQLVNGGLEFRILSDADCNLFRDYGQHLFEIERAYQPIHPEAACAVLYLRPGYAAGWSNEAS